MTRAEEAALKAYPDSTRDELGILTFWGYSQRYRDCFIKGYETAEKETIERAIAWLKENANKYIVDLTPTYPDAPANIIVGGMCWEHLKDYLQNEETKK